MAPAIILLGGEVMDKVIPSSIPIKFSFNDSSDDRFTKVTIDVLNTGRNYNYSVFNKDVVEANIDTLKNIPIVGFLNANLEGLDFKGHEYEYHYDVDNDEYKETYLGAAYGLIPENPNYRWTTKTLDDGRTVDTLQVDGYLWNKFDKVIDIFKRDGQKAISMELNEDSIDGDFDDNGYFVFTKFAFEAICILGKGIEPAMEQAHIKPDFVKKFSSEMISEFNKYMKRRDSMTQAEFDAKVTELNSTIKSLTDEKAKIADDYSKVKSEYDSTKTEYEKAKADYEKTAKEYTELKTEYDTMKPKYDAYVKAEADAKAKEIADKKEEIFTKFDSVLSDVVDYTAMKEKKADMSVEEIETQCAIMFTKKSLAHPAKKDEKTLAVNVVDFNKHDEETVEDKIAKIYG